VRLDGTSRACYPTGYNKLEGTDSRCWNGGRKEVGALRSESNRRGCPQETLAKGAALKIASAMAGRPGSTTPRDHSLFSPQLDYSQAHDEFIHAMAFAAE